MTKRFEVVMNEFDEVEYIMDKAMMEDRDFAEFIDFVEDVCKENEELKQQKQQYKGQRDYLLFVIERTCSKELFEETKSYLKEVE